ncbi:site-specific integrase [Pontibacter korlensis]|uniref:site-specific integrase n=1 Tax=Pontibacter korlensis TaxID=400092 RepID=UPI000AFF14C4
MSINFSLLFYLKKPKNYQTGPVPIYLRVTVAGKRAELTTSRSVEPERWISSAGRAIGTKAAALVGDGFAPGTLERYTTSLKHTQEFMKWKYGVEDMEISEINHAFVSDYEFYLRSVRKCSNNTAVKYIKNFGKIIRICLANGWISSDPFANYKSKVKTVERVFLSEDELQRLAEKEFPTERLAQVRDIFLFSCFTGLAYVDVQKLRHTDIQKGIDGEQWIFKQRQKTDTPSRIPLLPTALSIINKYRLHPQCLHEGRVLPVPSNQKMNAYLKEIAALCGI